MKAQLGINQILITLKLKTLKTEKSIKVVIIKNIKNPYNHHFKIVVQAKGNRMNY